MREVGTFEARNSLSNLLELVEKGEEITITRHGKPVAKLVPATKARDIKQAGETVRQILELRKEARPDPDGLKVRDYVEMGRRY